jgi:hypothetical protein
MVTLAGEKVKFNQKDSSVFSNELKKVQSEGKKISEFMFSDFKMPIVRMFSVFL